MVQFKKNYAKKMKFWQYAVGIMLAILVFAAVVVADMMQYSERSTFSHNPFSLLGVQKSNFGGELEFLESGEMIWRDDATELSVTKTERRLEQGTVVLGGTYFETTKDTAHTNQLWFGHIRMFNGFTTVLVDVDDIGDIRILTGGGSVELYFGDWEVPVIIPAHSQIKIPYLYVLEANPEFEYFTIREDFGLSPLSDNELSRKLNLAEMALAGWRTQFGHFAWNIPQLWVVPVGPVVQFLEKITIPLPSLKQSRRDFQAEMGPLVDIQKLSKEDVIKEKLEKFRNRNLNTSLLQRLLIQLSQESKEWTWFEFAQKYWLPVVSPNAIERSFAVLWESDGDAKRELIRAAMLLSHNGKVLATDEALSELSLVIENIEEHPVNLSDLGRMRREITAILDAFPIHRSKDNLQLLGDIARLELDLLVAKERERTLISIEVGHDVLRFVGPLIDDSSERERVIVLNSLWADLASYVGVEVTYSPDELEIIRDIELVGITGITPAKMRLKKQQLADQEAVSEQLGEIKDEEPDAILSYIDSITNAKKLWEFLANENIQLDITAFRTNRTEMELTTRFANTEAGTRKIEGVFDYGSKAFRTLTLGEESTEDLPAHQLSLWMKFIGGKFDFGEEKINEVIAIETNGISQNAPQSILARKLTQEVLKGLGAELAREDIEVVSDDFQLTKATNVVYDNARLTTEYNLLTRSFINTELTRSGVAVTRKGAIASDSMGAVLEEMLLELRQY